MRVFKIGPTLAELRKKVGTKQPITLDGEGVIPITLQVEMLYNVTHCDHPVAFPHGYDNEEQVWLIAGDTVPAEPGDEQLYMALLHTTKRGRLIQAFLVTEPDPSRAILFPAPPLFAAFCEAAAAAFASAAKRR